MLNDNYKEQKERVLHVYKVHDYFLRIIPIAECNVNVHAQVAANMAQIKALEQKAALARLHLREAQEIDIEPATLPQFLTYPKDQLNIVEGKRAHFEAKVEPITDPHLQVEWLKDGKPIIVGHRFRPIHDFGYVALDINGTISEDTGLYTCRATNLAGTAECQVRLLCRGKDYMVLYLYQS